MKKAKLRMFFAVLAWSFLTPLAPSQPSPPDLILVNGKVFTSDPGRPFAEALAIHDSHIVAVGSTKAITGLAAGSTRRIDLGGRVVIPGINDAHYHHSVSPNSIELQLKSMDPTWEEVRDAIAAAASKAPKAILIRGLFGPALLDDPRATRGEIDKVALDHPVVLECWTGHSMLLNSAGLKLLGVPDDQPDPIGGRYVRTAANGKLTGMAFEFASFRLLRRRAELAGEQEALQQTRGFLHQALRFGITSVQDMSAPVGPAQSVALFEKAQTPIRIRVVRFLLTDQKGRLAQEGRDLPRNPSPFITVSGTKWVLDGTPIERSAAMRKPYADHPDISGDMNFSEPEMEAILRESLENHDQLLLHIVGDRTTENFLKAMEATGGKDVWSKRRVRIEHGEGILPDEVARAKELGVVVVQNPTHLALRGLMMRRFGPKRADQLQPLRSLLDAGIPVALGSDGPLNPYLNIMLASVYPGKLQEAVTRQQAVIAYTLTAAYAEFAEKEKGSLEPGKLADLAVLSQDIFQVPSEALSGTESVLTMVGGKIVYDTKVLR